MTRSLTRKQTFWAYQKWCDGYRLVDIAEALNCHEKTIRRSFQRERLERTRSVLICPPEILGRSA